MKKKIIVRFSVVLLLVLGGCYFYYNVLYKEARNIQNEKSEFLIAATNLAKAYAENTPQADLKYLNQTLEINGKVTEISDSTVVLDGKVFCKMNEKADQKSIHKTVSIKGRCIGYDDLFEQVKLDQCIKR